MKRLFLTLTIIIFAVLLTGCVNLLEAEAETVTTHVITPYVRPPVEQIAVSDPDEFKTVMLEFIMDYITEIQILYHNNEGEDVQASVDRVKYSILYEHPVGAYAITDIRVNATRIITHFEVDIEIEYKRTQEEIDSIIYLTTERQILSHLLDVMSEYREQAVIRTRVQLSENIITEHVRDIYYQNPRRIVMLPFVTVETFPEEGIDKIYEIMFGYTESPRMLQLFGEALALSVRQNAERIDAENEGDILLTLVRFIIASTNFDEGVARAISAHGTQNLAATAFGALVRGSAVGEGFAMAFKALCDELGIENRIVLGYLDGMFHAWNIVSLYGNYYHIDVAMCAVNGIESAFLKTDEDFEEMLYTWDRENTVICNGELSYEDIAGVDEPDEPDEDFDPDNPDNQTIDEDAGNPNNSTGAENTGEVVNPGNPEDNENGNINEDN